MSIMGSVLVEVDFAAIEAVLVGWFARDPSYIRLAKLGVHAGLASHILGRPFDVEWLQHDPARAKGYLAEIKAEAKHTRSGKSELYDVSKRVVHGSAYGLTPYGMVNNFPEQFPTVSLAKRYQDKYFSMAPAVHQWQQGVQRFAYDHKFLGGPGDPPYGHPYAYKHWFWSVSTLRKITEPQAAKRRARGMPVVVVNGLPFAVEFGEDAKRALAFYPQSTGRGVLTEAGLRLFDPEEAEPYNSYIGDAYFGLTPLRAPIHDSLFLELPWRIHERVLAIIVQEMTRPIAAMPCPESWGMGSHLVVDVEAKVGKSWDAMETLTAHPHVESEIFEPALPEEEEDVASLETVA